MIDSVRFISLITVIGLDLGSLSAWQSPESRSNKMAPRTLLWVCEIVIMIAVATTGRSCRLGAPLCLASRMESDTVRLTYQGGVRGVSMLVQMLEEQGVSVQYTMPRETRDMTEAAAIVAVVLSATGNIHDIAGVVQKFRQKFGAHAQIEDLPEPMQSVEERLAAVDRLLANGKITPDEYKQQRTRILNEL